MHKFLNVPIASRADFLPVYVTSHGVTKDAFSVMIQSRDYGSFPDLNALEGKKVVVTGTATAYQGKLEIVATLPDQIKIVDEAKSAH